MLCSNMLCEHVEMASKSFGRNKKLSYDIIWFIYLGVSSLIVQKFKVNY